MEGEVAGIARARVPIYGVAISHVHGVLRRALSPFAEVAMWQDDKKTCRAAR